MSKSKQTSDSNKTKTGKARIFGLTVAQLTALVAKESKPKARAKILNRIRIVTSRRGYVAVPETNETV